MGPLIGNHLWEEGKLEDAYVEDGTGPHHDASVRCGMKTFPSRIFLLRLLITK